MTSHPITSLYYMTGMAQFKFFTQKLIRSYIFVLMGCAIKYFYMHTPFNLWISVLHVQMICTTDLYDCVNPYTIIILYVLYAFVCF